MISKQQQKILAFPYTDYEALICDGSIRSGKTSLMFVSFVDWAMDAFNGKDFIVIGFTFGTAVRNVIDPWLNMTRTKKRYNTRFVSSSKSGGVLTVSRGDVTNSFYVFGADTERAFRKIQGMTAAGCFVDEVALCVRSAVDQALARCSVDGSRFFFNCNPDSPNHWFYKEWILDKESHNALHLHFTLDDNPSLSERIKERFRRQYSGVFKRRYIDGEWVIAEGLVYPFAVEDIAVPSDEADGEGAFYISCDYGITNPFCALLWRIYDNKAYLVDEYYFDSRAEGYSKTDSEHYAAIDKLAEDRAIQALVIDPSASSFKQECWRHDRFVVQDANNAVIPGISTTAQMLNNGVIKIAQRCYNTLQEIGLYVWSDKAAKDEVVKLNDHAMDAMRYFAYSVARFLFGGF